MVYWILLLVGAYSALAVAIWQHRPRSVSNVILATYAATAAAFIAGLLMVGTAAEQPTAEIGASLTLITAGWLYWLLLPLAVLGLFLEARLRAHARPLILMIAAWSVAIPVISVIEWTLFSTPLVSAENNHYILRIPGNTPLAALGIVMTSQVGLWAATAMGVRRRRIALWTEAIPLNAAALVAVLLLVVVHRITEPWQIDLLALSSLPPVLAVVSVVLINNRRLTRATWLEREMASVSDAALLLDAQRHVIWQNAAAQRWLDGSVPDVMTSRHVSDVIANRDLRETLKRMLAERVSALEFSVHDKGEDVMLLATIQPLDAAAALPGARLITLSDVTASRMRRDLEERSRELLTFSRISTDIASTLDLKQVAAHALCQLTTILPADGIAIYLADAEDSNLFRRIDQITAPTMPGLLPVEIDLRGQSVFSRVAAYQRPSYNSSIATSPFFALFKPFNIQAGAIIPSSASGQLNCLLLVGYQKPHTFDAIERAMLESVGQQVAVAVHNARLHEQEKRQRHIAETLSRVAGTLSQSSLPSALQHLLEQLAGLVAFERATVMIIDTPGLLRIVAHMGLDQVDSPDMLDSVRVEIDQFPYLRQLFDHGAPQYVTDTTTDPQWQGRSFSRSSWIGVPLIVRGQVLGCFSLSHNQPGFFSRDDLQMAATFAAHAAIAVENAQMFQREQQRRLQAELLYKVSYNLITSPDLDSALRGALIDLAQVCPFDRAHVDLLDAEGRTWTPRVLFPPDTTLPSDINVPIDDYLLIKQVLTTRQPLLVSETRDNPLWKTGRFTPREVRSWMGIPLIVRDRMVGIFNVDGLNPNQFNDEHLRVAQTFALQMAGVMEMFRLLEEADHRLKHLRLVNEVGRYSAAILGTRTLIDSVAARLFSRLHYHQISVAQADGGALSVLAVYRNGDYVPPSPEGYPAPCLITQQAYETAVPVWVGALPANGRRRPGSPEHLANSMLAVPMLLADEAIGVLTVERRGPDAISQEDVDLLEPLSAQLAISVSNARLFEKVRQQALELEGRVVERTEQIRQQQQHTEAILSSVADAVIVLDLHGRVVKVNRAARQLFDQYDLEFNLSTYINTLVTRTQAQADSDDNSRDDSLLTEEIEMGAVVLQAKAASVWAGDDRLGMVIVLRDISFLKELDRMRDTFVSHVSHELRTPLANVKLYLSLVEQGRPERRADYLGVIATEIDRLERLITDLLHLSRLRSEYHGERPKVRDRIVVNELIEQVITVNHARADQQNQRLIYSPPDDDLPPLVGNADQLVRALTNLVSNAINYTPQGGEITIRARAAHRPEHTNPEWVIIEVSDTGVGIPGDELPLIFDRFYRATNVRMTIPGTGLGLAIIKEIVELHNGTIEVESEIGRGTTFKLALPVASTKEFEGVGQ